ncbi:MAG: hypothetical protein OFPI_43220 [Osedax symbiont Rs2]|nr:MAG: hypothetical protein OFPI_43220 [Osedax symbiont Rs2]
MNDWCINQIRFNGSYQIAGIHACYYPIFNPRCWKKEQHLQIR